MATQPGKPAARPEADAGSAIDYVMSVVRADIARGRYGPGDRLVEAQVQRALGCSRGTVREAFARLAAQGLLELERYKSPTVRPLGGEEVRSIFEMRELLEGLAARRAAQNIGQGENRATLERAQAALDAALGPGRKVQAYLDANARYHEALVRIAAAPRLADQLARLSVSFLRMQMAPELPAEGGAATNGDHQAITAAVLQGDAPAAELLMRAHIRKTAGMFGGA